MAHARSTHMGTRPRRSGTRLLIAVLGATLMLVLPILMSTPARADASPDDVAPVVSSAGFVHPGVFVNLDELKTTKAHVLAGDKPWIDNFNQLRDSPYVTRGAPTFNEFDSANAAGSQHEACSLHDPSGCVTVCGWYNNPDVGCSAEQADARAVYGQALMYWYTDDDIYARRAIAILNAYAEHFKGNTGKNGPLMTAWTAEQMIRGAELLRYIYSPTPGGAELDVDQFSVMLRTVLIPTLTTFDYGQARGNWQLSAADGLMNTAVFLDDRALYDRAVTMWRERVMSYIYLSTDGDLPIPPSNYAGAYQTPASLSCLWLADKVPACQSSPQTDPGMTFQNGQSEETCRDFAHTSMGLSGIINAAETAWIQGQDLYGEQQTRIITGVLYTVQVAQNQATQGLPSGFCDGVNVRAGRSSLAELAADVFYNAYAVRKGVKLSPILIPGYITPSSREDPVARFISENRANDGHAGNLVTWDALTHHLASYPLTADDEGARSQSPPNTASAEPTPFIEPSTVAKQTLLGPLLILGMGLGFFVITLAVIGTRSRRHHRARRKEDVFAPSGASSETSGEELWGETNLSERHPTERRL